MAKTCPKCHSENTDTARFCSNCATALVSPVKAKPALTKTLKKPAEDLAPGIVIGAEYEVLEKLGRGGMGEVYRGLDKHLDRQVAIKVLPEEFSADPERLARFRREAKLLAALNHPNIEAVHELEESGERKSLILEMIEGETLQAKLDRGAMAIDEALETCRQVAAGLEAAHEKGIVHRDLKPGNIMIAADGQAKILDFGLAKAEGSGTTGVDIADSPTITAQMTEPGVILGTAAYMSPEQARGRAVDKRSDIWAWGCVLYECLTGTRAFQGETVSDTLAQILKDEPDWSALPTATPACVRSLLARCLKKDRKERLRDIGDARLELEEAAPRPAEVPSISRRTLWLWMVGAAAVIFAGGILMGRFLIRRAAFSRSAPMVMSTIKVEPGHWLDGLRLATSLERPSRTAMAISSDGNFVVYSAIEENPGPQAQARLFLRRMDRSEAKPIPGTEGGISPFLGPDDRWLGFWADGKLKKIPIEGGVATTLCDSRGIYGADWGTNNMLVFTSREPDGLLQIPAGGGEPETLTKPDPKREEYCHRLPFYLPDGSAIVFTVMKHPWDRQPSLALLRLDTHSWTTLLPDAADARYVPTGHLVFLRQGTLMAVRFDLARLEVFGPPQPIVENVTQAFSDRSSFNTGAGQFALSDAGKLVYATGGLIPASRDSLVWRDMTGSEKPAAESQQPYFAPRLSPDGQRIAYTLRDRNTQVWVCDLKRGTNSRLTVEGRAAFPIWTPDGQQLLFTWQRSTVGNIFRQPSDGSLPMARLATSEFSQYASSWSPDGKIVALAEYHTDAGYDICALDVASGHVTPFLNTKFRESYPEFSPDGRWIAYASDESGREEVYVRHFQRDGGKFLVSTQGGNEPLWARDGRQLFYRRQDEVWAVNLEIGESFSASKPRLLFKKSGYSAGGPIRAWDLSKDGSRFLMVRVEQREPSPLTEMVLVQNWFEELKRLVPAK